MKTKKAAKKISRPNNNYLKRLQIEVTEKGFIVWTVDRKCGKNVRHWVIDASCLKEDGQLRLGTPNLYKTDAHIDVVANKVRILKTK